MIYDLWHMTRGNREGKVLVVYDCPTAEEARKNKPFTSPSATPVISYLRMAGVAEHQCLFTPLSQQYLPHNDFSQLLHTNKEAKANGIKDTKGLFPTDQLVSYVLRLEELIETMKPSLIITMGAFSTWALCEEGFSVKPEKGVKHAAGMVNWRGSHLFHKDIPLLPVFSPSEAIRVGYWGYKLKHDIIARVPKALGNKWADWERDFKVRPSFDQAVSWLNGLIEKLNNSNKLIPVAVDIETRSRNIACIGFADSITSSFCIPIMDSKAWDYNYWSEEEEIEIVSLLRVLLTHEKIYIVGQNFLFDAQYIIWSWQIKVRISADTMLAQHLIFPGSDLNLNNLSSMYCDYHRYWKDDGKHWEKNVDEDHLWIYNCRDCVVTLEAWEALESLISYYNLDEQWPYQIRQANSILTMMIRGVRINFETKWLAAVELNQQIEAAEEHLDSLLPEEVWTRDPKKATWFTSVQQQAQIFHDVFKLKRYFNRKVKRYTVDDSALEHFAEVEPILRELCNTLRAYRSLTTFRTFTEMQLGYDGRMRSSYSPTAETFRWKSSSDAFDTGGNLQNLPKGNE